MFAVEGGYGRDAEEELLGARIAVLSGLQWRSYWRHFWHVSGNFVGRVWRAPVLACADKYYKESCQGMEMLEKRCSLAVRTCTTVCTSSSPWLNSHRYQPALASDLLALSDG